MLKKGGEPKMSKLRDELLRLLNEQNNFFALIDVNDNIIQEDEVFLTYDLESQANSIRDEFFPEAKIVKIKFVAPQISAPNRENQCFLIVDKDSENKLFIYNEESEHEPKTVFTTKISNDYLLDELEANVVMLAYIERE